MRMGREIMQLFLGYKLSSSSIRVLPVEAATGAVICVCFTIIAFVISLMWFSFYEVVKKCKYICIIMEARGGILYGKNISN